MNGSIHIEVTDDKIKITIKTLTLPEVERVMQHLENLDSNEKDSISGVITINK